MRTKQWLFLLIIGFAFAACEKEDDSMSGPPAHSNANVNRDSDVELNSGNGSHELFDGASVTVDLIAGQHYNVGQVEVYIESDFMYVTYSTYSGSYLTETHLHVGTNADDFPLVGSNNPQVGLFMFSEEHDFLTKYTYKIPAEYLPGPNAGDCYYIAAHAVVNSGDDDLESFSEMLVEIPTAHITVTAPSEDADSYFPEVTVSSAGILNGGDYNGWCLEQDKTFQSGEHNVFSSYGNGSHGYSQELLNKVNWILNQRFQDKAGYTHGDVQMAIWVLRVGAEDLNEAIQIDPGLDCESENSVYLCGVIENNAAMIDNIVLQANKYGSDFVPACGEVFAILFSRDTYQDIVIEYPVPCNYGEETAWGDGLRFNERGNWAMYFQLCEDDK